MALIGQAVSEKTMFEYYGNIHVCYPGVGADVPLVSMFFQYHSNSVLLLISCKIFPLNDMFTVFPIQMHRRPMLTVLKNRSRSSQGHDFINCSN